MPTNTPPRAPVAAIRSRLRLRLRLHRRAVLAPCAAHLVTALLVTVLLAPAPLRAGGTILAGAAAIDITPSWPVRLSGFGSRRQESDTVRQRLSAGALAIGDGPETLAIFIAVDNLGIPFEMTDALATRLGARVGLRRERLAVTATHTHSAPMLTGVAPTLFGMPIPADQEERIDRYTRQLLDRLEEVAAAAVAARAPATLSWGKGSAGFARNRRTTGGPVDHSLPILAARGADGSVKAVLLSYACHCVTLSDNLVSGDWAGYAREAIIARHPGAVALVSIGCGGDQNPDSGVTGDRADLAAAQGAEIAAEVERLLAGELAPIVAAPRIAVERVHLPLDALPSVAQWEELAERADARGHHARVQLARLSRGEKLRTSIPYPIQAWHFDGGPLMVLLPGEVVVDYALRLRREIGDASTWTIAYANDAPCYIPSERVLAEGGYEGGGAMIYYDVPARLRQGLEDRIIAAARRLGEATSASGVR